MPNGWFAADPSHMIRRLAHIRKGFGRVGRQVSRSTADAIAVSARNRVHVRTGYTKSTIRVIDVNQTTSAVIATGPGAVAEEYGTRHRPAHPFLAPAVMEVEPRALTAFKQTMLDLFKERG